MISSIVFAKYLLDKFNFTKQTKGYCHIAWQSKCCIKKEKKYIWKVTLHNDTKSNVILFLKYLNNLYLSIFNIRGPNKQQLPNILESVLQGKMATDLKWHACYIDMTPKKLHDTKCFSQIVQKIRNKNIKELCRIHFY